MKHDIIRIKNHDREFHVIDHRVRSYSTCLILLCSTEKNVIVSFLLATEPLDFVCQPINRYVTPNPH